MSDIVNLSRRGFLRGSGGLALGFYLAGFPELEALASPPSSVLDEREDSGTRLNAWLEVHSDGRASIRVGAVEMGQGVYTALPMLVAEELDLPFDRVQVVPAPVLRSFQRPSATYPWPVMMTGASESVRGHWTLLRRVGAQARTLLVAEAAARWNVAQHECQTEAGVVRCGTKSFRYEELVADAAKRRTAPPVLRSPEDWSLIGSSPPRTDIPDKVTGAAIFGIDVRLPGMLHASIRRCPHHGGSLKSADSTAAEEVPGVIEVILLDDTAVVVAESFWAAEKAAKLLQLEWAPGEAEGFNDARVRQTLSEALDAAPVVKQRGHRDSKLDLECSYGSPYLAHAPIEPLNATVWVQDDRVDVWAPTQVQAAVKTRAHQITGRPRAQCHVHSTLLGGGFGRKSMRDFTDLAIETGLRLRRPIQVVWSREETFGRGRHRPATRCRLRARLDDDGYPSHFEAAIASQNVLEEAFPGIVLELPPIAHTVHGGLGDNPYDIPNQWLRYKRVEMPIQVGWWRSVHGSHNGFYRESFIDELAYEAGIDPIVYRLHLLRESPRHLACYQLALAQAPALGADVHRGTAIFKSFGSIVATVLDLKLSEGRLDIQQITMAVDCGRVVHPDTVRAQLVGASLMGLSSALHEEVRFEDGAAQVRNFNAYRLLTMAETPTVEAHIVPSEEEPGGVGEVALPPLPAALANAIFAATGLRLRELPLGEALQEGLAG